MFIFSLALLNYKNVQITQMRSCCLQLAGVPCEGRPSYWVSADGSYQEEGMNNGGKIWDKVNFMRYCLLSRALSYLSNFRE